MNSDFRTETFKFRSLFDLNGYATSFWKTFVFRSFAFLPSSLTYDNSELNSRIAQKWISMKLFEVSGRTAANDEIQFAFCAFFINSTALNFHRSVLQSNVVALCRNETFSRGHQIGWRLLHWKQINWSIRKVRARLVEPQECLSKVQWEPLMMLITSDREGNPWVVFDDPILFVHSFAFFFFLRLRFLISSNHLFDSPLFLFQLDFF